MPGFALFKKYSTQVHRQVSLLCCRQSYIDTIHQRVAAAEEVYALPRCLKLRSDRSECGGLFRRRRASLKGSFSSLSNKHADCNAPLLPPRCVGLPSSRGHAVHMQCSQSAHHAALEQSCRSIVAARSL